MVLFVKVLRVGRDYVDVVILADVHSGSRLSPKPEHFKLTSGEIQEPSDVQRGLNRALETVIREWYRPHALVVLGDAVDGTGRHDSGSEQWSTQPLDQIKCAAYWINAFEAENVYVLRGSKYHVRLDGLPVEEVLASKYLKNCRPAGTGDYVSAIKFIYEKWGLRFHFAHHQPVSQSEWFLATPIQKEGIRIKLAVKRLGDMNAIFRAHNHIAARIKFGTQVLVSCPCWQLPTEWLHKKGGEPLFDIGATRVRIFKEPDEMGKRMRVQDMLFEVPEANTRVVKG